MGDYRADIKITFTMFGRTLKYDGWLNYFPDEITGVDRRVMEFFQEGWEQFRIRHDNIVERDEHQRQAQDERDEYLRLKAKFEPKYGARSKQSRRKRII